jgi:CheY-like chemotaxis protein
MIIGYLDLAMMNPNTNPDVAELIKNARRSGLDAATRVRQLQRFTKKTSRAKFRAMDINNLLEEAVQQSRPLWKDEAEKKGLQFSFQKSYGKIEAVDGDDGEIRSALHNLIKNAVEAMPSGGTITLETGVFDKKVYIRISDTGIGMDEETKKRIFEPFFTTKGYKLGMGLGMSIVHSTIRDHGGKIFVRETEVGKGTMFEMLLPIMAKKEEASEEQVPSASQITVRVLWVDDEEIIRKTGKLFLEQLGHAVDVAASGEEAISLLAASRYDLMVTDIGMPKMSGWQLLKAINGKYSEMKVVVLSGWGAAAFDDEKAMHNIEYILGKPITQADLKKLLDQMFQAKA